MGDLHERSVFTRLLRPKPGSATHTDLKQGLHAHSLGFHTHDPSGLRALRIALDTGLHRLAQHTHNRPQGMLSSCCGVFILDSTDLCGLFFSVRRSVYCLEAKKWNTPCHCGYNSHVALME